MDTDLRVATAMRPVQRLLETCPETDFARFLAKALKCLESHSLILEKIREDQLRVAKEKKKMRLRDRRWRNEQENLPGMEEVEVALEADELSLGQGGRPRMAPRVVYVFSMLRGYLGSLTSQDARDFMEESTTLNNVLENWGVSSVPAESTLLENVNALSQDTLETMHEAMLEVIGREGRGEFTELMVDSTAVQANTEWPTDATILRKLLERAWRNGTKLEQFDQPNLKKHWTETWLGKMSEEVYGINQADHNATRKKHYRRLFEFAEKLIEHLEGEFEEKRSQYEPGSIRPSQQTQLMAVFEQIREDLSHAKRVLRYGRKRVFENEQTPSSEKVLSVGDSSAAFIKKGDREPTIGYRPQLVRSGEGFVVSLQVPEGNRSDKTMLSSTVQRAIDTTGVVPRWVVADDGYTSSSNKNELKRMGIDNIVFCGAKGKTITADEEWESEEYRRARRNRSAVESMIFTLKFGFDFGELSRRGIQSVRQELWENAMAYNLYRWALLESREESEPSAQKQPA